MANINNDVIDEFVQAIQQPETDPNTTYSAIVSRVDNEGVVWVNLVGSDKETPTASTASEVKRGDNVTVNWRNNKLYIEGNYSDPSAGTERVDRVEHTAKDAHTRATEAKSEADKAVDDAERARVAAESAEADAAIAAGAASAAQQSASNAGISASQAQAASEAAQLAALSSITTDVVHYLATDLDSGITTANPPAGHGTWSTTVQTMTSANKYLWTYHTYSTAGGSSTDTTPVLTGTYGEKGADGTSVTILGSYNTLAELQAAHPTGTRGDAYMVSGDLYVWNGSAWENVGQIQGQKGDPGVPGTSVTITSIAYAVTTTEAEPSSYPYSTAPTVPEGSWLWTKTTFSDGNSAVTKSKQGVSGTNGTDGDDGVSVTSVQPQYYLHTSSSATQAEIDTWNWSLSLTYVVGKFIWTRDYITYSDGSHGTSTAIYNQALTQSCKDAAEALGLVEEQQEYFWHDTLGAHVLSDKDTVSGTRYRTDIKGAGLEVFELDGQSDTSVAKFGDNARVGVETSGHTTTKSDGLHVWTGTESTTSNEAAFFGTTSRIGSQSSKNVYISPNGVDIRNGSTALASFTESSIQLGKTGGSNWYVLIDNGNAQPGLRLIQGSTIRGALKWDAAGECLTLQSPNGIEICDTNSEGAITAELFVNGSYIDLEPGSAVRCNAVLRPTEDDIYNLGTPSYRWQNIYASNKIYADVGFYSGGHSSPIGTVFDGTVRDSLALTSGTAKYLARLVNLPAGKWVAIGSVRFPANTAGGRRLNISTTQDSTAITVQMPSGTNNAMQLQVVEILQPSSETTYYLNAYQNSGSSLTASDVSFRAIRIA